MTKMRAGWPQGEALLSARTELSMDWYHGPGGSTNINSASPFVPAFIEPTSESAVKLPRRDNDAGRQPHAKVDSPCNDFNTKGGCGKQKLCPYGAKHVCNRRMNGGVCGSSNHCAVSHDAAMQKGKKKQQFQAGDKGKGGKGKGAKAKKQRY